MIYTSRSMKHIAVSTLPNQALQSRLTSNLYFPGRTFSKENLLLVRLITCFKLASFSKDPTGERVILNREEHASLHLTTPEMLTWACTKKGYKESEPLQFEDNKGLTLDFYAHYPMPTISPVIRILCQLTIMILHILKRRLRRHIYPSSLSQGMVQKQYNFTHDNITFQIKKQKT